MSHRLLDSATAVTVSRALKLSEFIDQHRVDVWFRSLAATKISAVVVKLQGTFGMTGTVNGTSIDSDVTEVIDNPTLAIGSTPERFANAAFNYMIKQTVYTKAVNTTGSQFTSAHVVSASKYGVINIYINASGTWVTRVISATQAYDTAAAAHAAADTIVRLEDHCYVGRILIAAKAATWTANTDDMTNGSDLTTATFLSEACSFTDMATCTLSASEITNQRATFHITDVAAKYGRLYLSTLTGTGQVSAWYTPVKKGY